MRIDVERGAHGNESGWAIASTRHTKRLVPANIPGRALRNEGMAYSIIVMTIIVLPRHGRDAVKYSPQPLSLRISFFFGM
jgi:hypothetical protein